MDDSKQKAEGTSESQHKNNAMLNAAERKLQNETGCKYGMRDCLYRMVHPKCFKCKERSEYEWDYTIGTV
jgi:hypothetical protein